MERETIKFLKDIRNDTEVTIRFFLSMIIITIIFGLISSAIIAANTQYGLNNELTNKITSDFFKTMQTIMVTFTTVGAIGTLYSFYSFGYQIYKRFKRNNNNIL